MDLRIIVPVYNVEEYIRPCIESIFKQGLNDDDFEVIIVNDGTEDNSIGVIQDIINEHDNIIVINQENQGLSVARNNGIALAKGEYILMLDSDDLLIENRLHILLDKALETKVDLIVADYLRMTNEVWRTLYRRSFIFENELSFIPEIYYEDLPFTHECYLKAQRCINTSCFFYIYRVKRPGSITASFSLQKARNYCTAIVKTWCLTQNAELSPKSRYKIEEDVYLLHKVMIYHIIHCIKESYKRKEIMTFLIMEAPDLKFTHNVWQRATTFMIRKFPFLYIELYYLYYQLVCRKKLLPRSWKFLLN